VCEKDDDTEVLKLRERQLHNIPEELARSSVGGIEWTLRLWVGFATGVNVVERERSGTSTIGDHK
jgi:hypothetical protein